MTGQGLVLHFVLQYVVDDASQFVGSGYLSLGGTNPGAQAAVMPPTRFGCGPGKRWLVQRRQLCFLLLRTNPVVDALDLRIAFGDRGRVGVVHLGSRRSFLGKRQPVLAGVQGTSNCGATPVWLRPWPDASLPWRLSRGQARGRAAMQILSKVQKQHTANPPLPDGAEKGGKSAKADRLQGRKRPGAGCRFFPLFRRPLPPLGG